MAEIYGQTITDYNSAQRDCKIEYITYNFDNGIPTHVEIKRYPQWTEIEVVAYLDLIHAKVTFNISQEAQLPKILEMIASWDSF